MNIKRRLQSELHNKKCMLEKTTVDVGNGDEGRFVISLSLTTSEFLTFVHAIESCDTFFGKALHTYLRNAIERA